MREMETTWWLTLMTKSTRTEVKAVEVGTKKEEEWG